MKIKVNKKSLFYICTIIFCLSALLYNILYINNKKNEIINEIEIEELEATEENNTTEEIKTIFVDVGGEVITPGLYELPENSRVNDAIIIAGGTTEKADLDNVNLAYVLFDAMKITIPQKETKKVITTQKSVQKNIVSTAVILSEENNQVNDGIININTATKEQLESLPGIGEATAQKILDYRSKNGEFAKKEDIKNVSGIGESKYEKIKEKIKTKN